MGGELDVLVAPLGRPVDAGDQAGPVDPPEVAEHEGVAGLRLVGRADGQPEMPCRVLVPGVLFEKGVLLGGGRTDLAPVAVEDVLALVDQPPGTGDGLLVHRVSGHRPSVAGSAMPARQQAPVRRDGVVAASARYDAGMDDSLRAWFDERVDAHAFSGSALAARGEETLFSYVGGLAHRGLGVPIGEDTRFGVASITKMVTAIAALRLVDQGLVRLDQPLTEILPAEQQPAALTREHTLHHLLSHTSGLANYHDDDDPTLASFLANWDRIPVYHIRRPADMLPLFRDLPAVAPPGTEVAYNDAAFILAGLVIEAVTGRHWDEVVADEVLVPAGMADTGLEAMDSDPLRLAVGYMTEDIPPDERRTNIYGLTASPMPDGGMITTPADLVRLVNALLGGRLVSGELLAAMTRPAGPAIDGDGAMGLRLPAERRGRHRRLDRAWRIRSRSGRPADALPRAGDHRGRPVQPGPRGVGGNARDRQGVRDQRPAGAGSSGDDQRDSAASLTPNSIRTVPMTASIARRTTAEIPGTRPASCPPAEVRRCWAAAGSRRR